MTSVQSRDSKEESRGKKRNKEERPVSKLRPKTPIIMKDTDTIFAVAEAMSSKRADAALLVNKKGKLSGIITDNDITRRVVSQFVDPLMIYVSTVMTKSPKCVQDDDSALDALEMMVDNRYDDDDDSDDDGDYDDDYNGEYDDPALDVSEIMIEHLSFNSYLSIRIIWCVYQTFSLK
jgi:CBS domain-containing protein